jgi:outer membrane receptor for ferric coprogen and ferric-rhodotorulic acid
MRDFLWEVLTATGYSAGTTVSGRARVPWRGIQCSTQLNTMSTQDIPQSIPVLTRQAGHGQAERRG